MAVEDAHGEERHGADDEVRQSGAKRVVPALRRARQCEGATGCGLAHHGWPRFVSVGAVAFQAPQARRAGGGVDERPDDGSRAGRDDGQVGHTVSQPQLLFVLGDQRRPDEDHEVGSWSQW